jgi:hypothetical protein
MIVGFLALRFPGKTFVLCVLDISLCDRGCDRGLIFRDLDLGVERTD